MINNLLFSKENIIFFEFPIWEKKILSFCLAIMLKSDPLLNLISPTIFNKFSKESYKSKKTSGNYFFYKF